MYKGKRVGVVVPAYNERRFICPVITGIPPFVDRVYVVDDCSTDGTSELAAGMAEGSRGRVEVIRHKQNGGVGKAIVTGYRNCIDDQVDVAAVMAGDNQMDPANLDKLLDPVVEGVADYAVGDRISCIGHMKGMSYWRRLGNWLLQWLTRVAAWNFSIRDPQNGFSAISHDALRRLDLDKVYPRYGYCNDLLVKLSANRARITYVQMPAVYGAEKSKIRYWHYIPTVSWLLLKGCLWRVKVQTVGRSDHHC